MIASRLKGENTMNNVSSWSALTKNNTEMNRNGKNGNSQTHKSISVYSLNCVLGEKLMRMRDEDGGWRWTEAAPKLGSTGSMRNTEIEERQRKVNSGRYEHRRMCNASKCWMIIYARDWWIYSRRPITATNAFHSKRVFFQTSYLHMKWYTRTEKSTDRSTNQTDERQK